MPSFFIRLPRDQTGAIPQFSAVGRKPGSAPTPGAAPQERPFLQLFPSDAAREQHHTVVPEHAAARDGADQLVQRMVPARVLPYGNETGVRLPKCRSMNRAGLPVDGPGGARARPASAMISVGLRAPLGRACARVRPSILGGGSPGPNGNARGLCKAGPMVGGPRQAWRLSPCRCRRCNRPFGTEGFYNGLSNFIVMRRICLGSATNSQSGTARWLL